MSFRTNPSNLVTYLRDNTTNLTTYLDKSQPVFYVGYPRMDAVEFPVVSISTVGGTGGTMAIGDAGNRYEEMYQVDIYTDTDANADLGGGGILAQIELCNYIASEINAVIRDNRCAIMSAYDWLDIRVNTPPRQMPYIESLDLYRVIMRINIQYNDPRA